MQLFLDCDGVLANFDKKAEEIFGMHPREFEKLYGSGTFWKTITHAPEFFYSLEMLEDAHELFEAVKHLEPIILTGVPAHATEWAPGQKRRWITRMFGDHVPVITCLSKNKCHHGKPGDILIDDWHKYSSLWTNMGGIFILHISAKNSIEILRQMGVL